MPVLKKKRLHLTLIERLLHKKRVSFIPVNQTLEKKLGTHEAAFYQLMNDEVITNKTLISIIN